MTLDDLPSLRESLAAEGIAAKRAFGQNFLLDLNVTRKIVRVAGPLAGATVIEVGPGPGGLTRALLEAGADRVIAVEKDARFLTLLGRLAEVAGRLAVVQGDALHIDEAALVGAAPGGGMAGAVHIVANLPYNVATPLLIKWLTGPLQPRSMTLMFQKEVAERIVAPAGSGAYGRLSVIAQALAEAAIALRLPARAFTPPPKVDSAVVRLDLHAERPAPALIAALETVTRHAFGQRRKMLRSSLKPIGGEVLLAAAGVEPSRRAEEISVAGFLALAAALLKAGSPAAD